MKMLCLGDSLTYGYGLRRRETWPYLLQEKLKSEGMEIQIINKGISGDTTSGMLFRFQSALEENPDLLFLMGGSNDICMAGSIAMAKNNFTAMISRCLAEERRLILGIPTPIFWEELTDQWRFYVKGPETIELCDRLFAEWADWLLLMADRYQIPILDFRTIIPRSRIQKSSIYLDGLHLNQKGQIIMADTFAKKIGKIY